MSEELINVEVLKPEELFIAGGTDTVLAEIALKVEGLVTDASTKKGRDEIKSMAYKVTRTSTFLEKMGKALTDDLNKQKAPIMGERNKVKETLSALAAKIRQPLTDYENAEKDRIAALETKLATCFPDLSNKIPHMSALQLKEDLEFTEKIAIEGNFAEFAERAMIAKMAAIEMLKEAQVNKVDQKSPISCNLLIVPKINEYLFNRLNPKVLGLFKNCSHV